MILIYNSKTTFIVKATDYHKHWCSLKKVARVKHSSLFRPAVSDEEMKFYKIETRRSSDDDVRHVAIAGKDGKARNGIFVANYFLETKATVWNLKKNFF